MMRLIITLTLLCVAFNIYAHEIEYSVNRVLNPDFSLPVKRDLNDDVTAQVEILADNIEFAAVEGNAIGGIVHFNDRIFLYLCDGSRCIRLYSEGNLPLDIDFTKFDDTRRGVKGGESYSLKISQTHGNFHFGAGARVLAFRSDVLLDSIIVNGIRWQIEKNVSQKIVPFGEYDYKAYSHGYKPLDGSVTVTSGLGSKLIRLIFKN